MRVIKFRVVCKDTKKVIGYEEFNTCLNDGYLYILESEKGEDQACHSNYSEKPMPSPTSPLSQLTRLEFTGLKDKNGTEIYEGDVVQMYRHCDIKNKHVKAMTTSFSLSGNTATSIGEMLDIRVVRWIRGALALKLCNGGHRCVRHFEHLARPGESVEVIGNIYENPELIK